jgi:hypothetical protein
VDGGEAAHEGVGEAEEAGLVADVHGGDEADVGAEGVGLGVGADLDGALGFAVEAGVGGGDGAAREDGEELAEAFVDVGAVDLIEEDPAALAEGAGDDAFAEDEAAVGALGPAADGVVGGPVGGGGGEQGGAAAGVVGVGLVGEGLGEGALAGARGAEEEEVFASIEGGAAALKDARRGDEVGEAGAD